LKKFRNLNHNVTFSLIVAFIIGSIIITALGENVFRVFGILISGAFDGSLKFGTTLQFFVPLFLTAIAFAVSTKVDINNIGVEGSLLLGAIAAAVTGAYVTGLSPIFHISLALIIAIVVGAAWAYIPAILKIKLNVNEITVTILLNYVALYFTSFLVMGPFSADVGAPRTMTILDSARIGTFLSPSKANYGIIIAIVVYFIILFIFSKTTFGYKITNSGLNSKFSFFVGINSKRMRIIGMLISGAIGGLAGGIEVLGVYGFYLYGFSFNTAFDGMLISLIAKNNLKKIPVIAFFIAALKSGALSMARYTDIPKSTIDMLISIFILLVAMDGIYEVIKNMVIRKKEREEAKC